MFDMVMAIAILGLLFAWLGVFINNERMAEIGLCVFLGVGSLVVILACIFAVLSPIVKLTGS